MATSKSELEMKSDFPMIILSILWNCLSLKEQRCWMILPIGKDSITEVTTIILM